MKRGNQQSIEAQARPQQEEEKKEEEPHSYSKAQAFLVGWLVWFVWFACIFAIDNG